MSQSGYELLCASQQRSPGDKRARASTVALPAVQRRWSTSSALSSDGRGNLGASPKPPLLASYRPASCRTHLSSAAAASVSDSVPVASAHNFSQQLRLPGWLSQESRHQAATPCRTASLSPLRAALTASMTQPQGARNPCSCRRRNFFVGNK